MLTGLLAKSQAPVANFTSTATSGCAPLIVDFKDASSGDPKFWNWDFGNGQLSNKQNQQVAYYYPGVYTVTLVVRNANGTNGKTETNYIVVNPSPSADFAASLNNVCLPATIQFTDQSQINAGTIDKWEWDFGDGTTSTVRNPRKAYSSVGFYNVSLKITSSTGCTNTTTKFRFIRVLPGVNTAFRDPVTKVCNPPYDLTFINETSGPGNVSYAWNFGNGITSTAKDPSLNLTTSTPLNVQLIARSDLGCSDTLVKVIKVNAALTTFTGADSACLNTPVTFQNTSSLTPLTTRWTFSDGISPSQQPNTTRSFSVAGDYTVKLVNTYTECIDSLIKNIKILGPPAVDFTSNFPGACKAPLAVSFQDISPNAVNWLWNFGDGGTSTQKNPSHSYTTQGEFDVTLTVTTVTGCQNTLTKPKFIRIIPPVVQIFNAPAGGCAPFLFSPVANINSVDAVSTYFWDFGDAGATSTLQNPSHSYNTAGNFTLKLSIVTTGGCTGSVSLKDGVRTGLRSFPAFRADTIQACSDSAITFTNLSTPAGLIYAWDFGDTKTSTDKDPVHRYTAPGTYTVSLTTSNNGCLKTETKPAYINVLPPIAQFTFQSDCSTRPTVTFTNTSIIDNTKPVSYLWKFGDPANTTSTAANPVLQYPSKTNYNVTLTVTNGDCVNTFVLPVALATSMADFTISSDTICRLEFVTFASTSTNWQNIVTYKWSVDGAPFTQGYNLNTLNFRRNGAVPVSFAITDVGGCSDTITKSTATTVIGSYADFAPSAALACINGTVSFNDLSTPVGSIRQWKYDFGDGTNQTFTTAPFTHKYTTAGSYNVSLTITGKDGCTDVITHNNTVTISKPVAAFTTNDTLLCPGGTAQFTDTSSVGPFTYLWKFGDGNTSTVQNPSHVYPSTDNSYPIFLKVTDAAGCSDSLTKTAYVKITTPIADFSVSDSGTICPPLSVEFRFNGKNYTSFYWDFGDNSTSTLDTPIHFYNSYGRFVAKLYVVGAGGCIDSSEQIINVDNPYTTTINYGPVTACNSLLVNFIIKKPATSTYTFYFGDDATDVSQKDTLQHFYSTPSTYSPVLELSEKSGCKVYIGVPQPIRVLGAEPFFSPDRKAFCDSGTVYFTNYTLTNDPIVSTTWNFGDGTTASDLDPIHSYNQPGRFIVSLTVNTQSGCSKTITDTIRVYKTPVPSIQGDSIVCINAPLLLSGLLSVPDSSAVYNWNLGNGGSSSQVNPTVTYTKDGGYTLSLEVANILGCKGSTTKNLVVAPLPVITLQPEITIPVGLGIPMPVTYSQNAATFTWTPPAGLTCSGCAVPLANPKVTTTYKVAVVDSNNCVNSAQIIVTVVCNEKNYFVPNTFSPNGDGNNDIFFPRGNNINRVQSMRIFSRWGEMIFEKKNFAANNPGDGWNGYHNGKTAPNDVYVYIVEFICENGSIIPFKGNVTLIR